MTTENSTTAQNDTDAAGSESSVEATPASDATATAAAETDTATAEGSETSADGEGSEAPTETTAEGDGEGEGEATPDGAPEQYSEFTTPEGYQLDEAAHTAFQDVAKDLNLTQENAQKLIDYDAKRTTEGTDAAKQQWNDTLDGWKTALKNDEVMGGAKHEESLALANKAIDAFGTPELRSFLDESGLGNHPELLRAFHKAGSAISEDQLVSGGGDKATPRKFYNNSNMN